ncbi:glycosyltransferase [Acinetobacter sp. CFCC 10889]|uniref:glycosyltransferase n=1 Tax=Acinetobacter sp. CFCC 10889 TaxID=1775557 RepID=UPI000DD0B2AD|nr:glycosyltransferase [Acinetobacter sp. CFCC 10889]
MEILFIGKRFYTNRDAYHEKFGRIYQLPYQWSQLHNTHLWLIDYHSKEKVKTSNNHLKITSTPIFSFNFLIFILKIIFSRPKIIVASGDCYIGLLGYILAKVTFRKFVFDVYDKYDVFTGYKNLGFSNLFHFLIKKSNLVFFASKLLEKDINQNKNYHIIPNGVDYSKFKTINKENARKNYNLSQKQLIIGYIGSIEYTRGIEDLINAVDKLRKNRIDIKILIAGKNTDNINLNYNFIHYLGNLDFNLVPIAISACDLLAIPYRRSNQINYGTSCKIAEYIAIGKPIIATESANILEDFPEYINVLPKDYLAQCYNSDDLAKVIEKQLNDPIILQKLDTMTWESIAMKAYLKIKDLNSL